ncbi:hypothetical protein [Plantactinospora sp. GCM10030261]|uniref:hypothetical protein n=1 Tax=Plantactinospora sp. GCM10030261 TaxID=3273420 RepID=UPI00360DE1E6
MGKHHRTAEDPPATVADAISCNLGAAYWSVDDCAWSTLRPGLPDDLIDLLAPPIVVGAVPVAAVTTPPPTVPATAVPFTVPVAPPTVPVRTAQVGGVPGIATRIGAPGTSPAARTRNVGTRRPPGRHRRATPTG